MKKRYKLILIPSENGRIRHYQIRRSLLVSALGVSALVIGSLGFLVYSYYNIRIDREELQQLRATNNIQRQELKRLAFDLRDVQLEMMSLAESEARVRQLAEFQTPDDTPVAIGGLPEETGETVDELQRQINQLMVDIEMRRRSQEDVRNLLNDQVSLSRATPKGWPTKGWVTSYFGMRKSPFTGRRVMHEGLDIAANTGTPIFATADGIVARVEYSRSYGKTLVVDHGYGYRTIFGHNSKILVKSGQRIKRGDRIALVGNTGQSTGPHLHYELRLNGVPIDPRKTL